MGARLQAAGVGSFAIFHHDPDRDDRTLLGIGHAARREFAGAFVAREGGSITS